jgi:hypothetical protein
MQTPPTPKSPSESQAPEDIKVKHCSLKRTMSVVFDDPPEQMSDPVEHLTSDLAFNFVQRIMSVLRSKRICPDVNIAVVRENRTRKTFGKGISNHKMCVKRYELHDASSI